MLARTNPAVGVPELRAARKMEATENRSIRFVASDESVDRYGDIIRAKGWDLTAFKKNPVLLFGHKSSALPIGKVTNVEVVKKELVADCEFMPEGMSAFADEVWRAVDGGFLNASSVGFLPTAVPNPIWEDKDQTRLTGFEFIGQELLELSVVPVPANPQALAVARSLAISEATQRVIFADDERALARAVTHATRTRTIAIARKRVGHFGE